MQNVHSVSFIWIDLLLFVKLFQESNMNNLKRLKGLHKPTEFQCGEKRQAETAASLTGRAAPVP